jgi:hypothetical protein
MAATVMDGAVVETGAMVAAGALVTPGKRVLAGELWTGSPAKKWRDLTEQERARTNSTQSAACVMPGLVKRLRLEQRRSEAEIAKVWNDLIDPTVTSHAQPTGIHKGTLFVNVDSNVWLSEIVRYRRQEILQRLQHAFGSGLIARISFRVG